MFGIFSLVITALAVWYFFSATRRFVHGFTRLIDSPQPGWLPINPFAAATSVAGSYGGRRVALRLEHPADNSVGRIVLAMQVRAPDGAAWKDSSETARNPELSRATFDLEGRYGLVLTLSDGWLQAECTPFGGLFPGRFVEDRWRNTLVQMRVLAEWLETRRRA